MADGQDTLNELNATPVNPVQQIPSAPSTGMLQNPSASDILSTIQAAQNAAPPAGSNIPVVMPSEVPNIPTPTSPDVQEHMSNLRRVLDRVGSILGGDETLHVKKDSDGNVTITKDPSTEGEKWGRIASAALGGMAQGLANSQGPGGTARGAAAGTQYGLNMPQQARQQVQEQATAEQQMQLRNAQKALTQQQIAQNAFRMKEQGIALSEEQSDRANQVESWITGNPGNSKVGDFSNMQDVMDYEKTHGDLLKNHARGMYHTEVLPDGKVRLFTVDQAWLDQKNDKPVTFKRLEAGDSADAPMKLVDYTIPAGAMTNRDIDTAMEAQTQRISKYQLDIAGQEEKATAAKEATAARRDAAADRRLYQQGMLSVAQENAETRRQLATMQGAGMGAGGGAHGDAYLQTIPENMREQVKSIARGDTKMPSGARSGSVQALRNAVFNYDPTYTDARYDTKQNFKKGEDAQNLVQLSTAMEHLERATTNSKAVGTAPLLGYNATAADARYNQDVKFFTQEAGKLVKSGVLPEKEYEDLKRGLDSSRQGIRDASLQEMAKLVGGKVAGIFQKYKAGAGNDIPVEDFFDAPTQTRLRRYGVVGGGADTPGGGATPQTHVFDAAAWKRANPTGDVNQAIAQAKAQNYTVVGQ